MYKSKEFLEVHKKLRKQLLSRIGHCQNCGYNAFPEILEMAHINHGPEAWRLVKSNIFLLCPTCHKAFDRGFIEIQGEYSDCLKAKRKGCHIKTKIQLEKREEYNRNRRLKGWKRSSEGVYEYG